LNGYVSLIKYWNKQLSDGQLQELTSPGLKKTVFDLTQFPLDPRITFTRNSPATYWDKNGVLRTAAVDEPRPYRNSTGGSVLGLMIEEAKTNLCKYATRLSNIAAWTYSLGAISDNAVVSPDGTQNASLLTFDAGGQLIYQTIPVTSGARYTFSYNIKLGTKPVNKFGVYDNTNLAWIVPTSTFAGAIKGEWVENVVSFDIPATCTSIRIYPDKSDNVSESGTSSVWGVQLELNNKSSFIYTEASVVTRQADVAVVQNENFSSWYNQAEGTLLTKIGINYTPPATQIPVALSAGSFNDSTYVSVTSALLLRQGYVVGGTDQTASIAGKTVSLSENNIAFAYKANDFAESVNGQSVQIDGSGSLTGFDRMYIGLNYSGNGNWFSSGYVSRIEYYNVRLPNSDLEKLSNAYA